MEIKYKEFLLTDEEADQIMLALNDLELILASVSEAQEISVFDSDEIAGIYNLIAEQRDRAKTI